jgi:hypothetical protein
MYTVFPNFSGDPNPAIEVVRDRAPVEIIKKIGFILLNPQTHSND